MSLFDDEFYSTKVPRRVRAPREEKWAGRRGVHVREWGAVRLALGSSLVSALAAVLLFSLIFGTGGGVGFGGGQGAGGRGGSALSAANAFELPIQAAAKIRPAVVSIINEQRFDFGMGGFGWGELEGSTEEAPEKADEDEGAASEGEDAAREDEGMARDDEGLVQAGLGSGVIYARGEDGTVRIMTNYHVIQGAARLQVVLFNGEVREARLVGHDLMTDLAVLEMNGRGITTLAELGDSTALRDGQTVIAIGNPLGLGDSLTMGIVSKTRRLIPISLNQDGVYDWEQEVIQIDASINQGNSGGALIDLDGRLVGINSMKVAEYGVEGLGFAIPMHLAQPVLDSLVAYGKVKRPYLGVFTLDLEQYYRQEAQAEAFRRNERNRGGGAQEQQGREGQDSEARGGGSEANPAEERAGSGGGDGSGVAGDDGASGGGEGAAGGAEGEGQRPGAGSGSSADGDADVEGNAGAGSGSGSGSGGLELDLPAEVRRGVIVLQAVGPAAKAGLVFNDVIVGLDGQAIGNTMELRKYLYAEKTIGDKIEVTFYRQGERRTTTLTLAELSEE